MARDQTRNIETFKIGGKGVNDFEFHKHQGEMAEHSDRKKARDSVELKPQSQAERVAALIAAAHEKVQKRKKKAGKGRTKGAKTQTAKASSARPRQGEAGARKSASGRKK